MNNARHAVADLMALVDTYADTAATNGIRSPWAQMARSTVEVALMKAAQPSPAAVDARKPLSELEISFLMPINTNMTRSEQMRWMARAVERAHGINAAPAPAATKGE